VKRSWRRRLLGRLVCVRRGHRPIPFRTEPKHPGVFCSRCLEIRGGGEWVNVTVYSVPKAWPWYAAGKRLPWYWTVISGQVKAA
jgi:hypothetical protein